ncbi:MFS transporter [Photobacterium sp. J15]|uniref:MFS transporter n=1 Tax=Photobacterium sp. J15 TaxID=265901 RepID=UPI0007E48205|nr:MFS transporter [Photobacterium sp. J15]
MKEHSSGTPLTLSSILLMAVACCVIVSNIYYNQAILNLMQQTFTDDSELVSLVPSATQIGYAFGLFFLVPLGDCIERRRLILIQAIVLSGCVLIVATSPNAEVLLLSSFLMGVTATVAQQIVPLAASLCAPEHRGKTVGIIMSGVLSGILVGRIFAGIVSEFFPWQTVFYIGFTMTLFIIVMLSVILPKTPPSNSLSYIELLTSLWQLWKSEPKLRHATKVQAAIFAAFCVIWTILPFLLISQYQLGSGTTGMFALIGLAGILCAPLAGKFSDKYGPRMIVFASSLVMAASWVLFGLENSLYGLVLGIFLLDLAEQCSLIANQHIIYSLNPQARNRINTLFMGGVFIGAAMGSGGATLAWQTGGWPLTCLLGIVLSLLAVVFFFRERKTVSAEVQIG